MNHILLMENAHMHMKAILECENVECRRSMMLNLFCCCINGIVDCDWDNAFLYRFVVVAICEVPVIELMLFLTNLKPLPAQWI